MEKRLCLLPAHLPGAAEPPRASRGGLARAWISYPNEIQLFLLPPQRPKQVFKKSIYPIFSLTKAPCECDPCLTCPTSQHQGWIRHGVWLVQSLLLERNGISQQKVLGLKAISVGALTAGQAEKQGCKKEILAVGAKGLVPSPCLWDSCVLTHTYIPLCSTVRYLQDQA